MIDQDAAADAALAYALWDAEHTTKMDPMRSEEYVTRARVVRVWLRTNGHDVRAEGWRTRKIANERLHGCLKCGAPI